jgi:hypothetical protein
MGKDAFKGIGSFHPLAKASGLHEQESIKAAFAPKNHQWLEAKKNMSKRNRWIG